MSNVKQIIVVRSDLRNTNGNKLRSGKICAQVAHASLKVFFDKMVVKQISGTPDGNKRIIDFTDEELEWINGIFTKIVVSVNSEKELLDVYQKSKDAGVSCSLIQDAGLTEFGGVATYTAVAIGPCKSEIVDEITGKLPLL